MSSFPSANTSKATRSSKRTSRATTMRTEKIVPIAQESPKPNKVDAATISKRELQEKEYEEEVRKKKLKEQLEEKKYRNISIRLDKEENIMCLSIDGSQSSKDALEIILTEFMPYIHNSVLICPHIYVNTEDEKFNWRYQKANVLEYYKTRLTTSLADYQGYLIIQDKDNSKVHEIEQAYKIAEINECKYFFCGYEGLREQALKPTRIDVGIEYLLGESKIPVFIMKDNKKRGNKNKGYHWLLVMDKGMSDSYRVIDLFLPLIDRSVDKIYGLTLLPHFSQSDEDVKRRFYEKMAEINFKEKEQFNYSFLQYKENPDTLLVDFVNHNTEQFFDFVVFLNNPMKFKSQKTECDSFKYIKSLYANIAFCNYAYILGYDYKELGKLPNEKDPRKYLDRIKKSQEKEIKDTSNKVEDKKDVQKTEEKTLKLDLSENENKINEEKNNEGIYSEIYGVNKGGVFESKSGIKNKDTDLKVEEKIEPKNLEKIARDDKHKKTWAPTNTKKPGGVMRAAYEAGNKSNKPGNKKGTGKK